MANKLITKYTWSDDWRLYNTKFNNGEWTEEDAIVDEETGEVETYYTIATYHILETTKTGNTITTTYAGIRVNYVSKFLIELLANSEPLSFDDIVAATCAHFGYVTSSEIIEVQTVVDDFINSGVEGVLVTKEYVTVAYVEALTEIANETISKSEDTLVGDDSSIPMTMSLDDSDFGVMTMSAEAESTETGDATTGDSETGAESGTGVDYDALINGTSEDPVGDILRLEKHRISSADWQSEKEYINYQYEFRLVITMDEPTPVHGATMTDDETSEEFTPKFVYPATNSDPMWGYCVGTTGGCEIFRMFSGTKNYNRDTLYEHCCEYYAEQLESGDTTLEEILDTCTALYNVLVVAFKLKKALLVE